MSFSDFSKAVKLDSVLKLKGITATIKAPRYKDLDTQEIVRVFVSDGRYVMLLGNYEMEKLASHQLFWDTETNSWFLATVLNGNIGVSVSHKVKNQTYDVDYQHLRVALTHEKILNNSVRGALPDLDARYPESPAGITISEVLAKARVLEISFFDEIVNQLEIKQQNPEATPEPNSMSLAEALAVAGLIVKVGRVVKENRRVSGYEVTWNEAISVEPASVQDMPNAYAVNFRDGNFLVANDGMHISDGVFPYLKNTVSEDWFPVIFEYQGKIVTYAEVQSLIAELKYKSQQPTIQQPAIERNRPFAPSSDCTLANLAIETIRYFQTKHSPEEKTVTPPTTQRKLDEVLKVLTMKNIHLFIDEPNSPRHGERIVRTFIPQPAGKIHYYIIMEKHAIIKLMDFNLNWCDKNNQWSLTDCLGERFAVKVLASPVFTEPTQAVEKPDESKSEDKTQGRPVHLEIKLSDILLYDFF